MSERCLWESFSKNQIVLDESDPSTDVFFVVKGSVSAKSHSENGKEVTYTYIHSGEIFGEFAAIDHQARSASVHAVEDTVIARMRSSDFRSVLLAYPQLVIRLAEHLVQKLRNLTTRVFEFSTMSVGYRVRTELIRYCEEYGVEGNSAYIEPAPTHYEIATLISTHREAITRELSLLESMGIISASRRRITVLDVKRLRSLVNMSGSDEI